LPFRPFHRFSVSLLHEHHKSTGGDHHVETTLIGEDGGTTVTNVLATIDGSSAVEDLLPAGVGDGQQILLDYITISEGAVVETRNDNNFLVSAPPLKGNNSIGVRLVEDVNVVTKDRASRRLRLTRS